MRRLRGEEEGSEATVVERADWGSAVPLPSISCNQTTAGDGEEAARSPPDDKSP
jgi:hypothetical protein